MALNHKGFVRPEQTLGKTIAADGCRHGATLPMPIAGGRPDAVMSLIKFAGQGLIPRAKVLNISKTKRSKNRRG
jgi:hypothetical protein